MERRLEIRHPAAAGDAEPTALIAIVIGSAGFGAALGSAFAHGLLRAHG
jgi:hypothetical protein